MYLKASVYFVLFIRQMTKCQSGTEIDSEQECKRAICVFLLVFVIHIHAAVLCVRLFSLFFPLYLVCENRKGHIKTRPFFLFCFNKMSWKCSGRVPQWHFNLKFEVRCMWARHERKKDFQMMVKHEHIVFEGSKSSHSSKLNTLKHAWHASITNQRVGIALKMSFRIGISGSIFMWPKKSVLLIAVPFVRSIRSFHIVGCCCCCCFFLLASPAWSEHLMHAHKRATTFHSPHALCVCVYMYAHALPCVFRLPLC